MAAQGSPDGWAEQSIHHPGPLAAAVACARALRQLFFTSPVPAGSNYLTMPGPIQWLGPRIGTPPPLDLFRYNVHHVFRSFTQTVCLADPRAPDVARARPTRPRVAAADTGAH